MIQTDLPPSWRRCSMTDFSRQAPSSRYNELIKKYEKIVEQFEKDNEPKEPMMVTGLANY